MKRWMLVLSCTALLGACTMFKSEPMPQYPQLPALTKAQQPQLVDANGAPIERVPFRPGTSSVTVENMAKNEGCVGGQGAGLMTDPGPVEVYRMMCDNGKVFRARCELRQCKRM